MEKRDPETIRAELEAHLAKSVRGEGWHETLHELECELARAEGRPEPVWRLKGVM